MDRVCPWLPLNVTVVAFSIVQVKQRCPFKMKQGEENQPVRDEANRNRARKQLQKTWKTKYRFFPSSSPQRQEAQALATCVLE